MKIAMPYKEGRINQHYGKSKEALIYTVEDNKIISQERIDLDLQPEQSIANYLKAKKVDTLIIGHCGVGAKKSIEEEGIQLIRGIDMVCDDAMLLYLAGNLESNEESESHYHDLDKDETIITYK